MIGWFEVWRAFWGEVNTDDHFSADPYGAATNQISHVALAAFVGGHLFVAWWLVVGEMPYRIPVVMGMTLGYLLIVEWWRQRWGPGSFVDGMFWASGAALLPSWLQEVPMCGTRALVLTPDTGLIASGALVVALALHVAPRAVRKYGGTA
jgi:hypothetical protein